MDTSYPSCTPRRCTLAPEPIDSALGIARSMRPPDSSCSGFQAHSQVREQPQQAREEPMATACRRILSAHAHRARMRDQMAQSRSSQIDRFDLCPRWRGMWARGVPGPVGWRVSCGVVRSCDLRPTPRHATPRRTRSGPVRSTARGAGWLAAARGPRRRAHHTARHHTAAQIDRAP